MEMGASTTQVNFAYFTQKNNVSFFTRYLTQYKILIGHLIAPLHECPVFNI